uniref:Uncharacterized protein n=1 Tax=Ditylenchus dipsaci TaxID=166011 RepID=A0A915CS15_9BILA
MSGRNSLERDDATRFPGYGDRVGSGVVLAPTRWTGGELVTDPTYVSKALKPKRMFYSPIGDVIVAADGIEMKRGPVDLTPRAGHKITEKTWTSGGGGSESGYTNEYGGTGGGNDGTGRNSRNTNLQSPFGALSDPLGLGNTGLGGPPATHHPPPAAAQPTSAPLNFSGLNSAGPSVGGGKPLGDSNGRAPYAGSVSSLGSSKPNLYEDRIKSPQNGQRDSSYAPSQHDYPASGRSSATSASLFSEPGMRYEVKKDYLISNPREMIHQYATTTPIQSIPGYESLPGGGTTTQTIKQSYSSTVEESFGPYAPYKTGGQGNAINPNKFVRQLRDETMTNNQRQANLNTQALNPKDSTYEHRIETIRRQTTGQTSGDPEIQSLTTRLMTGLQTGHPTPSRF